MWSTVNGPVSGKHGPLVGAVDQGTSSTRVLVSFLLYFIVYIRIESWVTEYMIFFQSLEWCGIYFMFLDNSFIRLLFLFLLAYLVEF